MPTAIIKYNAGNIQSVSFALERLNSPFIITDDPEEIQKCERVIFPGVGEASTTMRYLQARKLDKLIIALKQPVLGICLGMQLMCKYSEENKTPCLGIFNEDVKQFTPAPLLKVPHMGWNRLTKVSGWIGKELEDQYCYFVHSYYVPPGSSTIATTEHGISFSAALQKDNFHAVQFHPEKSARAGERILEKFLGL